MREEVPAVLAGERVDRAVAALTGLPRAAVASLVETGAVRLDGRPVATRSQRVSEAQVLEVDVPEAELPDRLEPDPTVALNVVHADSDVVVVDKPAGLVVHPGSGNERGTLVHGLLALFSDMAEVGDPGRPGIVHRLDKGTSGLLVAARTAPAYHSLVAQLKARAVDRRYLALVWGHVESDAGLVDAPVGRAARQPTRMAVAAGGREARTRYQVEARYTRPVALTLVECRLETGRTHQIRVHLAAIGHPVVGDERYRGGRGKIDLDRPFLHAHRLAFDHPGTGERVEFSSALPAELERVRGHLE